MLMGEKEFCDQARTWLTRFGGNLYTKLPYAALGWHRYRIHVHGHGGSIMSFQDRFDKLKRITYRIKAETLFSKVGTFNPTVPETNMIHVYLKKSETCCENVRDGVYEKLVLKIFTRRQSIQVGIDAILSGLWGKQMDLSTMNPLSRLGNNLLLTC